jgi:hypothetical protein
MSSSPSWFRAAVQVSAGETWSGPAQTPAPGTTQRPSVLRFIGMGGTLLDVMLRLAGWADER